MRTAGGSLAVVLKVATGIELGVCKSRREG
jgi:hypothetical protein